MDITVGDIVLIDFDRAPSLLFRYSVGPYQVKLIENNKAIIEAVIRREVGLTLNRKIFRKALPEKASIDSVLYEVPLDWLKPSLIKLSPII